jgi:hypothetical protein
MADQTVCASDRVAVAAIQVTLAAFSVRLADVSDPRGALYGKHVIDLFDCEIRTVDASALSTDWSIIAVHTVSRPDDLDEQLDLGVS